MPASKRTRPASKRERPPTISDVAKLAGVSLPTVSRVLTGSTPVRDGTRARVHDAMKELSYRPNGAARALVKGRQPIVGVLTQDVTSFGATQMINGIEAEARRAGYVVAVAVLDPTDLTAAANAIDVLLNQPIVGVVVLDFHRYNKQALLDKLNGLAIATVTDSDQPGSNSVVIDDRGAARQVTEHLLSLGHPTVHHVGVPGVGRRPHPREVGWREALQAAGAPVPDPIISDWSIASGRAIGKTLATDPAVTAVFCANDDLAFGVMRSLHDAGLSIPGDVSVAGMDDHPLADTWIPALTTYRLDFNWAGLASLRVLLDSKAVARPDVESFHLVERASTGRPRATTRRRSKASAPSRAKRDQPSTPRQS